MNAWWNLLKKEYRMARTSTAVHLGIIIIIGLWVVYSNLNRPNVVLASASFLVIFAAFYPAIFMLKYINKEIKHGTHLWLHSPQPAWMLISAKLAMALAVMLSILLLITLFVYITIFSAPEHTGIILENLALVSKSVGFYLFLAIIGFSIYIASWSTLIIVVTASARKMLGRYKWLAGFATFYLGTWGVGKLQQTWLFDSLTQWGPFKINLVNINQLPANNHYSFPFTDIQLYAGQIIIPIILSLALFALSSWLLDNKVEV